MARYVFCGSRDWKHRGPIRECLEELRGEAGAIVAGGARGADTLAEQEARAMGFTVEVHPALWKKERTGAGFKRNERMLDLPDVAGVYAFRCRGKSNGTDHTVRLARKKGIPGRLIRER